jgi:hypothetical protein
MVGRRWLFGACAMLAGCNLLSGASDLVTGADPGASGDVDAGLDGALAPDGDTSSGGPDGSSDAMTTNDRGPLPDAAFDQDASPPDGGRLVFVTSAQMAGNLGGVAGADQTCTMPDERGPVVPRHRRARCRDEVDPRGGHHPRPRHRSRRARRSTHQQPRVDRGIVRGHGRRLHQLDLHVRLDERSNGRHAVRQLLVAAVQQRRVQHGASPLLLRELIPFRNGLG